MFQKTVRQAHFLLFQVLSTVASLVLLIQPSLVYAASSPWDQTDWSGGAGQTAFTDATKFDSSSNIDFSSTAGQFTLSRTANWFNNSWKFRKQITFDNSAQAENLIDFPVLVKLTTSNFDYSKAKSDGSDLRFTDSNGTTALSYEIESYNNAGDSFVWVKVPQINASSNTDSIYVYYGNAAASDAQSASNVWNSGYQMVQHLSAASGTTTTDSTSHGNNGTKVSATEPNPSTGQIDGAQTFDGSNDRITIPDSASLKPGNGNWTVSVWANPANVDQVSPLITKRLDGTPFTQWSLYICNVGCSSTGQNLASFYIESDNAGNVRTSYSNTDVVDGNWHQYTFVADQTADIVRLFLDGTELSITHPNDAGTWPTINGTEPVQIGNNNGSTFYSGSEDEVRVSNVARTPAWIAASYKTGADTFNTFGTEQPQFTTSPGTLTSSIFDSGQASDWGVLTYNATTPSGATTAVKMRSSNSATMVGATAFASCSAITSGSDISSNSCITDGQQYLQYQVTLSTTDLGVSTTFQDLSTTFAATAAPTSPPSSSSDSSSSSGSSAPVCNDVAPTQAALITNISSNSNSATLSINLPDVTYDSYAINYGLDSKANNYGAVFSKPAENGVVEQKIGSLAPATTYYFSVQLRQGCNGGALSNTMSERTSGLGDLSAPVKSKVVNLAPSEDSSAKPVEVKQTPSPSAVPSEAPGKAITSLNLPPKVSFWSNLLTQVNGAWSGFLSGINGFGSDLAMGFTNLSNSYFHFQSEIAANFSTWFDPEATEITQLKAAEVGKDYIIISWKTSDPATSKVSYGANYDYGQDVQSKEKVTDHKIKVTGLKPNTTYYYEVMSQGRSYVFDARHEVRTLP